MMAVTITFSPDMIMSIMFIVIIIALIIALIRAVVPRR